MNYVNDRFCELVQLPRNRQAILAMKKDVDDFLPSFCDSPAKLSRWGHHYFCDDDGG
jgi:oligo-alginate lyase